MLQRAYGSGHWYAGEELTEMWHGTDSVSALAIVREQHFNPSGDGMLGKGVYITTTRARTLARTSM